MIPFRIAIRCLARQEFRSTSSTLCRHYSSPSAPTLSPKDSVKKGTKTIKNDVVAPVVPKKPKAPRLNPPKRPSNILQLIVEDVIAEYKSQNPTLSADHTRQCFRVAADRHKYLTPEDKEEYERRLQDRRREHAEALANFISKLTPEDYLNEAQYRRQRKAQGLKSKRRGLPKFDPSAPKRPITGFLIFCSDVRENPSLLQEKWNLSSLDELRDQTTKISLAEGSKVLASAWKALPIEVREDYVNRGRENVQSYHEAKELYEAQLQDRRKPK